MNPIKKHIRWCARQKNGIKTSTESIVLQKAYLQKSRSAIKSMEINAREGVNDWAVAARYYARYDAVYALLSRLGIKCEIHDCTIALFKYLFSGKIEPALVQELERSKDDRIDAQYYTATIQINQNKLIADTKNFVLAIEQAISNLTKSEIKSLQAEIRSALNGEGRAS